MTRPVYLKTPSTQLFVLFVHAVDEKFGIGRDKYLDIRHAFLRHPILNVCHQSSSTLVSVQHLALGRQLRQSVATRWNSELEMSEDAGVVREHPAPGRLPGGKAGCRYGPTHSVLTQSQKVIMLTLSRG